MTLRTLIAFVLLLFTISCGSTAPRDGAASQESTAARWEIDDDANVAYPACPRCGEVVERGAVACARCGARVHVEAKTIACPECGDSKVCIHCGAAAKCVACDGTHLCPICDGTGMRHGEACPECDGRKTCPECAPGARKAACERCDGTRVCANCEGTGAITLE